MSLLRMGGWRPRVGIPSAPRPPPPHTYSREDADHDYADADADADEEVVHASPDAASMGRPAIQGFQLPSFYHQNPGDSEGRDDEGGAVADDEGDGGPDWRPSGPPIDQDRICQGGQFVYQGSESATPPPLASVESRGIHNDPLVNPWKTTLVPKKKKKKKKKKKRAVGNSNEGAAGNDDVEQGLIQSMLAPMDTEEVPKTHSGAISPYFSDGGGQEGSRRIPGKRSRSRSRSRGRSRSGSASPAMYKEPLPGGGPPSMVPDQGQESSTYETDAAPSNPPKRARTGERKASEERFGVSGFSIDGRREAEEMRAAEEVYRGEGDEEEEEEDEEEARRASEREMSQIRALRSVQRASSAAGGRRGGGGSARSILGASVTKINTDCCKDANGDPLYYEDTGEPIPSDDESRVWCFGCQWGAHGHRPVDKGKINTLVMSFMNMILNSSTTLENVARITSDNYRQTIRAPAASQGQWLPDWPPEVVQRHIENMTEPRIVNTLHIRAHLSIMHRLVNHTFRVDMRTGEEEMNLQAIRVWCAMLKESRTLYAQVPKESFGYNEMLRAETWCGGTLVHPTRIRAEEPGDLYAGAPALGENKMGGGRGPAVADGGADTGDLRGPANDEELIRRPTGYGMGLPK